MSRAPDQPATAHPNLVGTTPFSMDRLLSHVDPGPKDESEEFVRHIYEQRRDDLPSNRNGQTSR
jgi:hypothetical protein